MNWLDKLFVGIFFGSFLSLGYLMFFDNQKKSLNTHRMLYKMQSVQDLVVDLKDLSNTLQFKNAISNIQASQNPDFTFIENSFKLSMISEIIEIKAKMMNEAIQDAIDELNKPVTYSLCELRII